jgi:hypothetical protein
MTTTEAATVLAVSSWAARPAEDQQILWCQLRSKPSYQRRKYGLVGIAPGKPLAG